MFLDRSLWAVTWGVDYEMAMTAPIHVHAWNNLLPATSRMQIFVLYLRMISTTMQRRQEVLPQHTSKCLCTSRVSQLLQLQQGKDPEHPSQPVPGSGNSELPWLSANDNIRSPDANAHCGNAPVHPSGKTHSSTFQALSCFLTPKPTSVCFSKDSSLVKHCSPKQLQVLLDEN